MLTLEMGWFSGEHLARLRREESRDRRLEYLAIQEAAVHGFTPLEEESEQELDLPLPPVPKTQGDALILLMWSGALLLLALAAFIAYKMGVPLPFLPKPQRKKSHDYDKSAVKEGSTD